MISRSSQAIQNYQSVVCWTSVTVFIFVSHQISICSLEQNSRIGCLPFSSSFGTMFWQITLATLLCCKGRYIEALKFGHDIIMCCIVFFWLPYNVQFGFICSSVGRFDFSNLANISSSWMANKYPSTCDEKEDFFNHRCVALSFTWFLSSRFQNK